MAVLTRGLSATARAISAASWSSRSPSTSRVTRCCAPSASAAMPRASPAPASVDGRQGQVPADDAGRADEHLFRGTAQYLGADDRHPVGVVKAALSRAGVGVAGADDDSAGVGPWQPFLTHADRSSADAVLRED